jgi:hypothetical protein
MKARHKTAVKNVKIIVPRKGRCAVWGASEVGCVVAEAVLALKAAEEGEVVIVKGGL